MNVRDEKVAQIVPLVQSTRGYEAEISLFVGKTRSEVGAITELGTDSDTSATRTNTALKGMILDCFDALAEVNNG